MTAEIMLTGEKEKTLVVGAAAGRDMEEAAASGGLEGMTPGRGEEGAGAAGKAVGDTTGRQHQSEQQGWGAAWAVSPVWVVDQAAGSDLPGGYEGPEKTRTR